MISDQDDALQSIDAIERVLQHQRNKRLDLQDLRRLFHDYVVVLESTGDKVTAGQRCVRARHRNNPCLLGQQVPRSVLLLNWNAIN